MHGLVSLAGHDDETDPAIDRIVRIARVEGHGRGETDHSPDLVRAHAPGHQRTTRRVRPFGGQLPVAVGQTAQRTRIRVSGETDPIGHLIDQPAQLAQDVGGVILELGATEIEHGSVLLVDDLDAQSLGHDIDQELILVGGERLALIQLALQELLERSQPRGVLLARQLVQPFGVEGRQLGFRCRRPHVDRALEVDERGLGAGALTLGLRGRGGDAHEDRGIVEVVRDGRLLVLGGRPHDPEQHEEGHHRGGEIGKGDLPGPAVMPAFFDDLLDDDRLLGFVDCHGFAPSALFGAPQMLLELLEVGTQLGRHGLAAELDRDLGTVTLHVGEDARLDTGQIARLLVGQPSQIAGDGADEAIGDQDAAEGADQRGGDQSADLAHGATERGHGMHDPEHGGHDAEGGQPVGHLLHGVRGRGGGVMMGLDLDVHEVFEFEGVHVAADHQPHVVGDELGGVMILEDERVLLEQCAALWLLDVGFDAHEPFLARLVEQLVQKAERFHVVGFFVFRAGEESRYRFERLDDHAHRIGDDEAAAGRAQDDDQFEGLPERDDVAAAGGEATQDGSDDDERAQDEVHVDRLPVHTGGFWNHGA